MLLAAVEDAFAVEFVEVVGLTYISHQSHPINMRNSECDNVEWELEMGEREGEEGEFTAEEAAATVVGLT